ncbi:MAG: GNAT family N-acetyltransferase [Chloroflexi bacterium]|nr:GNAT family N-acetyltransferase [Chloroflexota bacterium]
MTKPVVQPVESGTVRLRLLEEADLEMTLGWRNQDEVRKWFYTSNVLTLEQHRNWVLNSYLPRDNDFIFVIESKMDGVPVGQISLYDIDFGKRRGEYGRLMIGNPLGSRKGFAREATRLILQFAFETLGLDEVYLSVIANNERAIALYKACGFSVDGEEDGSLKMSIRK